MIGTNDIKRLREKTGAGVLDCRDALTRCDGDFSKAVEVLREKGAAVMEKRAEREAAHGYIAVYSHSGLIGSMVELRCETDFVSGNQTFRDLAHEIALQVAAASPQWVAADEVPADIVEQLVADERAAAESLGKPEHIVEQITKGKLAKFYQQVCLLEQLSIRDDASTVGGLIQDKTLAFGERIYVHQFARFAIQP